VPCDLPSLPDGGHYRQAEIVDAVDAVDAAYAAIEIVVSRFQSYGGATPLDRLADNLSNAGLVLSAPCSDWRRLDCSGCSTIAPTAWAACARAKS
jgi:2-keto-4-pentenoate hydratase